ncbi:MAG TPA: branched-chain amino acid ABC transporter permease, partial [Rhodopila sp.]
MNRTHQILIGSACALLLVLFSFTAPMLVNDYFVRVMTVMCINAILVLSMGLTNGFTGVFSLGQVGFVAVGAYVSGVLSLPAAAKAAYLPNLPGWIAVINLGFFSSTIVAGLICILLAFLVGRPLMRLSGHFVSVATLGFLIIVNNVLINA